MTTGRKRFGMIPVDCLFQMALALYFVMNIVTFCVAGIALFWYVQSLEPVVTWDDPGGPGYRIVAVTPTYLEVQWLQLGLARDCPGRTDVALVGERFATHIDSYPFLIGPPMTFIRRYLLPKDLPQGRYEMRVIDSARCNPLFDSRQVLRIPFESVSP